MSAALTRVSLSLKNPTILKKSKHKKLDEDWFDTREPINDGMMFAAKYIGMTLVYEPKGDDITSSAVQRIINLSKGSKKQGVQLMVSSKGIKIYDPTSSQLINDITIQRISYCAALKHHLKIFAFVAQNETDESMECHAYLCNTVKEAQTLTVTVAQSFKIAFENDNEQISPKTTETNSAEMKKEDETGSNFIVMDGGKNDKKTSQMIRPTVLDKKYQRLSLDSNPFETSDQELNSLKVSTPEGAKIMKREEFQSETNGLEQTDSVFVFSNTPKTLTTKTNNQPITPILPPPASTRQSDKPSPRRSIARPTSVGNLSNSTILYQSVQTPSPSQPTRDLGDWDQGFADLALSRTKPASETTKPTDNINYPPSNPFFSPGNPFT